MIRVNVYVDRMGEFEVDVEGGERELIQVWIQEEPDRPYLQYEREPEDCGSCVKGIVIDHDKGIQCCDECKKYKSDHEAALAVWTAWEATQ